MKKIIKGAAIVALATAGMALSACGSETATANATATPDAADLTAAALDSEVAANPGPAPTETASGTPSGTPSAPAH
jgi:hypothetical protein